MSPTLYHPPITEIDIMSRDEAIAIVLSIVLVLAGLAYCWHQLSSCRCLDELVKVMRFATWSVIIVVFCTLAFVLGTIVAKVHRHL